MAYSTPPPARSRPSLPRPAGAVLAIVAALAAPFVMFWDGTWDRPIGVNASAPAGTHAGTRGAAGTEAPGLADVYRSSRQGGIPVGRPKSPATELRPVP